MPLTADRAKPAVPFGGIYRLIDFALSNVVNSGYLKVVVLTQYKSHSLDRHVTTTWRMSNLLGNYVTPVPAQQRVGKRWYLGSADAIYQSLNLLTDEQPDIVVVVGADHVYRMDFSQMVADHVESGAGCTVAAIRQPICAGRPVRRDRRRPRPTRSSIRAFLEKPKDPVGLPDSPDEVLASMGNYVFTADALRDAVTRDAELEQSKHDMGGDIVPWFVDKPESAVYDYKDNEVPGSTDRDRGYWRDVGTMRSYYDAHMDLVSPLPVFNLYNKDWPIFTSYGPHPPAKLVEGHERRRRHDLQLDPLARCRGQRRHREPVGALAGGLRPGRRRGLRLGADGRGPHRRGRDRAQRHHRQGRRRARRACRSASITRPTARAASSSRRAHRPRQAAAGPRGSRPSAGARRAARRGGPLDVVAAGRDGLVVRRPRGVDGHRHGPAARPARRPRRWLAGISMPLQRGEAGGRPACLGHRDRPGQPGARGGRHVEQQVVQADDRAPSGSPRATARVRVLRGDPRLQCVRRGLHRHRAARAGRRRAVAGPRRSRRGATGCGPGRRAAPAARRGRARRAGSAGTASARAAPRAPARPAAGRGRRAPGGWPRRTSSARSRSAPVPGE